MVKLDADTVIKMTINKDTKNTGGTTAGIILYSCYGMIYDYIMLPTTCIMFLSHLDYVYTYIYIYIYIYITYIYLYIYNIYI